MIDFSKCANATKAMRVFANALGEAFDEKCDDDDVLSRFREAEEQLTKKKTAAPVYRFLGWLGGGVPVGIHRHGSRRPVRLSRQVLGQVQRAREFVFLPYTSIVQSSGFGKTRLLRELAALFETDKAINTKGLHRLVYVNARDVTDLTLEFPPKTDNLMSHFFPAYVRKSTDILEEELADQLVELFELVMQRDAASSPSRSKAAGQPESVSELLQELFSSNDAPLTQALTNRKLLRRATKGSHLLPRAGRRLLVLAVDGASALLPKPLKEGVDWFRILRKALQLANATIHTAAKYSSDSGIFGILVDTDSKICIAETYVPRPPMDRSQRRPNEKALDFPPFVLTHTMDVLHATIVTKDNKAVLDTTRTSATKTTLERYREEVIEAVSTHGRRRSWSWKSLHKLGRPLWLKLGHTDPLIDVAARKLLRGKSPNQEEHFNDQTLNGVAAVLCRLGVRARSSSPMSARLVADFMAVLSYVGYKHDQFVSSYSSDPILTMGATRVWHSFGSHMLATRMLPQLRKLLSQEVLDTGDVGLVVARIVLLLAMDACCRLDGDSTATHWDGAGEFFSVWTFLTALQGSSPELRVVDPGSKIGKQSTSSVLNRASISDTKAALEAVESHWKDWYVSFTHFIQLEEELSEACLWAMLGRRAAGIMPRGQNAVDLVIPICTIGASSSAGASAHVDGNVRASMILVRVENPERSESPFPTCATTGMRPSEVFAMADEDPTKGDTPLSETEQSKQTEKAKFAALAPDSVLRIYMSPRSKRVERFYVEDKFGEDETSYVLCLLGLGPVSIQVSPPADRRTQNTATSAPYRVNVQTDSVVEGLQELLKPWERVQTLVEQDVDCRDKENHFLYVNMDDPDPLQRPHPAERFGMSKEELVRIAVRPLAETVLLNNTDEEERIPSERSQLGKKTPACIAGPRLSATRKRRLSEIHNEPEEEKSATPVSDASETMAKAAKKARKHKQT